ncbi:MAG: MgtC/SapB family protein [Acidimicrobiales bacterium]
MIARVAVAAGLGALLGVEREFQHKTAGLRTHTLVAAGAALFTVAGASVASDASDATRVAAQVVTGIGFIGAGGMIKSGFTITGITTAATLWFAAAIGVATGFGLFGVASGSLAVGLIAILVFSPLRRLLRRKHYRLRLEYRVGHMTLTPLFEGLDAVGAHMQEMSMSEQDGRRMLTCEIVGIGSESMDGVVRSLHARPEVIHASASAA